MVEKYDINFEFYYSVDFSNFKFDLMDFINICGNLIDNVFYYVKFLLLKYVGFNIEDEGN